MSHGSLVIAALSMLLFACTSADEPRYSTITITRDADTATLGGVTAGETPALELAPGCAGYVDEDAPDHVIVVRDQAKLAVEARSDRGPVALIIQRDDLYFCDSDDNTGHAPALRIVEAGRYAIRVAALGAPAAIPYTLTVAPDSKERPADSVAATDVSVTVTSEPSGATVRTPGGQVLGVTPAMFVLPQAPADGGIAELVVELEGHNPVTVSGTPVDGELVLHASLGPAGPVMHTANVEDPQALTDFRSASLSVDVEEQCTIGDIEADVSLRHSYIGDLLITLRSPGGRTATLHRYGGGARHNLTRTWSSRDSRALERFRGDPAAGTWQLTVRDNAELDSGYLDRFTLRVECD